MVKTINNNSRKNEKKKQPSPLGNIITFPKKSVNKGTMLLTTTNEPLMPVRLYYKIHSVRKLKAYLSSLSFVAVDQEYYVLLYCNELAKIELQVPYNKVPKNLYPIIIAHCAINDQTKTLQIDVKSFDRAIQLIKFFAKALSSRIIKITDIATYNRFIYGKSRTQAINYTQHMNFDKIFNEQKIKVTTVGDVKKKCQELSVKPAELILQDTETKLLAETPVIEKFPVYLEDGMESIEIMLYFKFSMAYAINQGDKRTVWQFCCDWTK